MYLIKQNKDLVESQESVSHTHTRVHTRVTNSPKTKKSGTKHANKSEKSAAQEAQDCLQAKRHLIDLTKELEEKELADKLKLCHSKISFLTCGQHTHKYMPNFTCEFRYCPYCARRRSKRINHKYLPRVYVYSKTHPVEPVHLILTQAQVEGETLKQSVQRLMKAFRLLTRSERKNSVWNTYFRGGLFAIETKISEKNLYHTHLHVLAFRSSSFDIELLENEWSFIGGGKNLYLEPITDIVSGLRNVLRYISKPLDTNRFKARNLKDVLNMKNARFFGTFGDFRKFSGKFDEAEYDDIIAELKDPDAIDYSELEEGSPCPNCSEPLYELRMTESEHIRFLQSLEITRGSP